MLLEFKASNYKTFKDELTFSLIPAPKQKGLDYSVFLETIGKKTYKGLCSAVIYGSNASGKTNIIGAMDTFKSIVLRGNLLNDDDKTNPNAAACTLELIPNHTIGIREPVCFAIKFIADNFLIEYSFSADLGEFLDADYPRKVLTEHLTVNNTMIFSRNNKLKFGSLGVISDMLADAFEENFLGAIALSQSSLNQEELFLMNGFKTIFSVKLAALISNWLEQKFMIIYRTNSISLNTSKKKSVQTTLNQAAAPFGINSNKMGYIAEGDSNQARLYSIFKKAGKETAIPAELYESFGTIRFVNMFPLVVDTLLNGGTLAADELDASIHPMVLMNIINIFHNHEINIHHAQLIFNTHNPVFLNSNLFRRDEIKFVERDEETCFSTQYSLSDFGTAGKTGVRKNENYMKSYFTDRFGAMKEIDFTPVLKELISGGK